MTQRAEREANMILTEVTGFVDETGRFYKSKNAARRAEIEKQLADLVTTYSGGGGTRSGGSNGSLPVTTVYAGIQLHTLIAKRREIIGLLSEYDALGD